MTTFLLFAALVCLMFTLLWGVGQVAATATAINGASPAKGPINVYLHNTGSGTEVVIFTLTPAGGTDQVLKQISLLTKESGELVYIPLSKGDTLKVQATDAATVNYVTEDVGLPSGGRQQLPPMEYRGYSILGARKYNSV